MGATSRSLITVGLESVPSVISVKLKYYVSFSLNWHHSTYNSTQRLCNKTHNGFWYLTLEHWYWFPTGLSAAVETQFIAKCSFPWSLFFSLCFLCVFFSLVYLAGQRFSSGGSEPIVGAVLIRLQHFCCGISLVCNITHTHLINRVFI